MENPFTLSVEPVDGKSYQYGFHLGTDLALARKIVEEKFTANRSTVRTMALKRGCRVVDCYDGTEWSSARTE